MSACTRLDLQTLGSQPIMPKNLQDHWSTEVYAQIQLKPRNKSKLEPKQPPHRRISSRKIIFEVITPSSKVDTNELGQHLGQHRMGSVCTRVIYHVLGGGLTSHLGQEEREVRKYQSKDVRNDVNANQSICKFRDPRVRRSNNTDTQRNDMWSSSLTWSRSSSPLPPPSSSTSSRAALNNNMTCNSTTAFLARGGHSMSN
jgi:hypothetical protein